uniref:Reverse transcriptase domain-containing protein n=1 Tax=Photinus pyralis TaxID=7054 RepID=A0A1Y1JQ78_PHOPY
MKSISLDNVNQEIEQLNIDLQSISQWATTNNLKLNPSKTVVIPVGTRKGIQKFLQRQRQKVEVGGTTVDFATSAKVLGMTVDQNLSWEPHVKLICRRSIHKLRSLYKAKNLLPTNIKLNLIKQLIFPI